MKSRRQSLDTAKEQQTADPQALLAIAPRLLRFVAPYWPTLLAGFLALLGASAINLIFPWFIKLGLNESSGFSLSKNLTEFVLLVLALFAAQSLLFYLRHYTFQAVGYRVVSDLRKELYRSLIRQDIGFFDRSRVGDLLSRLSSDTQVIQRAVTTNISVVLRYSIQVIGGVVLMLFLSVRLTMVIVVLIPLLVLGILFWGRRLRRLSRSMQDELGEASVIAEESVGAIRTVRVFAGEEYEASRYAAGIDRALSIGVQRARVAATFSSVSVFLLNASIAAVLWYGGSLVLAAQLSIGDLTAFILYCAIVAVSFAFLVGAWDEFMQAVGASERIFEITDQQPKIASATPAAALSSTAENRVRFEAVHFSYPARPDIEVLHDISFSIEEGQSVALVGPSGSGKSTIASLIPRFYDPTRGQIYFAGQAIRDCDLGSLRSEISIVEQVPSIFSIAIGRNIAYGRIDAGQHEIEQAARAANIHDFIASLPDGYDTLVGDRGVQLSGGQRQRVAIARALLKDPKLLILDEATSALDSENERLVQEALNRLMNGRSSLVIAHRLSTVQHADKVLVLQKGRIAQSGTHEALVKQAGLYQTLVQHQLLD